MRLQVQETMPKKRSKKALFEVEVKQLNWRENGWKRETVSNADAQEKKPIQLGQSSYGVRGPTNVR